MVGPGTTLCCVWWEREDALVYAWRAEGEIEKRKGVDSVVGRLRSAVKDLSCRSSNFF